MVTSVMNEEQLSVVKPDAGVMINRSENPQLGFDQSGLRREFTMVNQLEQGQRYVEEGSATFLSGESDMPEGPTGIGEVFGNVNLVSVDGGRQKIPRYTHGFTVDIEDGEVDAGAEALQNKRDGILEMFDVAADLAFLQGMDDEAGNVIFEGVFAWLQSNMPTENIIDASSYDLSAGDLNGVPANIVTQVAYKEVDNLYMTTTWDIAAAKPQVWGDWNSYGTFDGAMVQSQWDLVSASENDAGVGVQRRVTVPPQIGLPSNPTSDDELVFDITFPTANAGDDDDVMFLIPNHGGDFYELWEEGSPDHRVVEKEGFRERHEYKWRGGVVYGQNNHKFATDKARDAVKIENVSTLFA